MSSAKEWFGSDDHQHIMNQLCDVAGQHNVVFDTDGKRTVIKGDNIGIAVIIEFVKLVLNSKDLPFTIEMKNGRKIVNMNPRFSKYIQLMRSMMAAYQSGVFYAPELELFFSVLNRHDVRRCSMDKPGLPFDDNRLDADVINDFVLTLRAEAARRKTIRKTADWQNAIDDNVKRLDLYMNALFERYARLVVVRVDLLYKVSAVDRDELPELSTSVLQQEFQDSVAMFSAELSQGIETETAARWDVTVLNDDRKRLFTNKRSKPSIFEHLVGHVWRIEWSRLSGYHLHCAFIFDGSKVKQDAWLGECIGKYWQDDITAGRGLYHNCNREKRKYGDHWGIGTVNHDDAEKREKLMRALRYLAKRTQYVYVKPTKKTKLFSTGRMPDPKPAAGRPRGKGKAAKKQAVLT